MLHLVLSSTGELLTWSFGSTCNMCDRHQRTVVPWFPEDTTEKVSTFFLAISSYLLDGGTCLVAMTVN